MIKCVWLKKNKDKIWEEEMSKNKWEIIQVGSTIFKLIYFIFSHCKLNPLISVCRILYQSHVPKT